MMILAAATDLLALFLGLETMSLAVYVLVGGRRGSLRATEAGLKYLLLGAFASAFLLFGLALLYGFAGATDYAAIAAAVAAPAHDRVLLLAALGLILIGFGFKIALVPFHMWTPDVYDGAASYVTGYMATGVKAAAFAALLRFAWLALPPLAGFWFPLLAALAVLTMTMGNLVALAQDEPQAHARLVEHRPRRLPDARRAGAAGAGPRRRGGAVRGGRRRRPPAVRCCSTSSRYALMNLGAFGVRVAARTQPGRGGRPYRRLRRPLPTAAAGGGVARRVHVLAGGHSAHGRLHGQVLHFQHGGAGGAGAAGGLGRHQLAAVGLLLPAGDRRHVHAVAGGRRGP